MKQFENGQRVLAGGNRKRLGHYVGLSMNADFPHVVELVDDEGLESPFDAYQDASITPAPRTHEEIAWEAICDGYDLDKTRYTRVDEIDVRLHAAILAAIEEACDG